MKRDFKPGGKQQLSKQHQRRDLSERPVFTGSKRALCPCTGGRAGEPVLVCGAGGIKWQPKCRLSVF